jgi:ribonuclease G
MQITRQRVRPAMDISITETCPVCDGRGHMKPSILFTDTLEDRLDYLVNIMKVKKFHLHLHPYVAAFIKKGFRSFKWRWKIKYSTGMKIIPNQSLALLEYKFYDSDKNEIDVTENVLDDMEEMKLD